MYKGIKFAKRRYPALEMVTSKVVTEICFGVRKEMFINKQHTFTPTYMIYCNVMDKVNGPPMIDRGNTVPNFRLRIRPLHNTCIGLCAMNSINKKTEDRQMAYRVVISIAIQRQTQ